MVRRWAGKNCVAQDEFLEHGNRFFSEFPMPRSLKGFANQSVYVGVGLKSKEMSDMWYTTQFKRNTDASYNKSVPPCMTPEKRLLYEVFTLLNTHHCDNRRVSLQINFITSIRSKLKTDLKRSKLDNAMKDNPSTSADNILATLSQVYQESIDKEVDQSVNPSEELSDADLSATTSDEVEGEVAVVQSRGELKEKIKKKTMHDNIGEDLWEIGVSMFAENDVLAIRSNAEETRSLKSDVRACILADIHASINGADIDERGHTHLDYMPSWQRHIRTHTNNLGLTMSR